MPTTVFMDVCNSMNFFKNTEFMSPRSAPPAKKFGNPWTKQGARWGNHSLTRPLSIKTK